MFQSGIECFLNKIICGDAVTVMRDIPDNSVGLVFTSPPYNLKNSTGDGMKKGRSHKWKNAALQSGYADYDDNMPHEEYVAWQRACLTEMWRVLSDDGAIFYNHKWRTQNNIMQDRADIVAGFPVRQIIIWQRSGGINFNPGYFLPTYEVIYLIAKPKFKLRKEAIGHGDVWYFPQELKSPHPAPFPLELARRVVGSTDSEIVLDPFMGSGTTAVAAANEGRHYIGIELSREYCDLAEERVRDEGRSLAIPQLSLFEE